MSEAQIVRATTVVAVGIEECFEVFTEDVDAWWRQGPRFRPHPERKGRMGFEPGEGGRLVERYDDGDAFELGRVDVWQPPKRIVLRLGGIDFGPDEWTLVEVRFEPVEGGTRVSVEHSGFEALRPEHPVYHGHSGEAFRSMMGLFWGDLLVALQHRAMVREAS
jgi:uncharacterized protein YndB with AHSA1/START domain